FFGDDRESATARRAFVDPVASRRARAKKPTRALSPPPPPRLGGFPNISGLLARIRDAYNGELSASATGPTRYRTSHTPRRRHVRRAEGVCGTRRRVPRNRPSKAVHIVTSRTAPSLLIVCALAMASPDRPFAAEATMATPPGLEVAGLERSELLLGQLGCASCHSAGAGEDRIFPRRGPVLGDVGARATRRYLEELIADPQSVKPGSPMPA